MVLASVKMSEASGRGLVGSGTCSISQSTGTATFAVTVSAGGGGRVTLGAGEQPVRIKTNARKYKARRGYKMSLIPSAPSRATHGPHGTDRSEEHTSELQSLMRTPYAVFCLKKKKL